MTKRGNLKKAAPFFLSKIMLNKAYRTTWNMPPMVALSVAIETK